jgi:hypothetical protein
MSDDRRIGKERRQVQRGGRRGTDLRALTPALRAEASEYTAEIQRCADAVAAALEENDLVSARTASKALKRASDALELLLATGKSMRQP